VAEAARLVAESVRVHDYDVVWQSRSGPPTVPWLEPDVLDHLDALHAKAVPAVLVSPIGFVSDHVEVVWDLDNEASERAAEHGMAFARAATAGAATRFARMVVELVREQVEGVAPRGLAGAGVPSAGFGVDGTACAANCCLPAARPRRPPAA
jgi:ferrochelatase